MKYKLFYIVFACGIFFSFYQYYRFHFVPEILFHYFDEHGSNIWVYQQQGERCLSLGSRYDTSRQSCISLNNPKHLVFAYQKIALVSLLFNNNPERILMIGLGGGTLATSLLTLLPEVQLDIVEINTKLVNVAKQFFGFKESKNTNIFVEDGAEFISNADLSQKYELIILDAFDDKYIPSSFLTLDFIKKIKKNLSSNGILVVNTFKNSPFYELESELYQEVFGEILSLEAKNNRLIIVKQDNNFPFLNDINTIIEKWDTPFKKIGVDKDYLLETLGDSMRYK